jgi:hypothetical protein
VDDFEDPGFYFLAHKVVMDVGFASGKTPIP